MDLGKWGTIASDKLFQYLKDGGKNFNKTEVHHIIENIVMEISEQIKTGKIEIPKKNN